MFNNFHLIT